MGAQVTLTEPEVRAFSSLLSRVSERLANYEQQTHQDVRHAEELKAAADDLLSRLRAVGEGQSSESKKAGLHGPGPQPAAVTIGGWPSTVRLACAGFLMDLRLRDGGGAAGRRPGSGREEGYRSGVDQRPPTTRRRVEPR